MTNKWKKGLTMLLVSMLLTIPAFTSCKDDNDSSSSNSASEQTVEITIQLDKTSCSVLEDDIFFLVATTNSAKSIRWTSSDTTIATVSASGRVIAKKAGTVTITANAEGKTAECVVTIAAGDPNASEYLRVSASKVLLDMKSQGSKKLETEYISVRNGEESIVTDKAITYSSADETIATVTPDGLITPIATGTTDIIVQSGDLVEYITADVYTAPIATPADWLSMFDKTCDMESRYYLTNDIDFTDVEYDIGILAESGNIDNCFFGAEINGDCYSVKNITMSGVSQSLFGATVGLKLKNISFENILFTAEANRVSGIAHSVGHHTKAFGEEQIFESDISNVSLDLVFETAEGVGVSKINYGINMKNVFIHMRRGNNSTVTEYPDQQTGTGYFDHETLPSEITTKAFMGISRMAYNWGYGKSSVSNVIVYCEIENAGGIIGMGYGVFAGDNVVYSEKLMRASYDAYQILDHNVWEVCPEQLPKLRKNV